MVGLAGSLLLLPETHPRLGKGAAPSNARPLLGLDRRTPSRDSQVAGVAAELAPLERAKRADQARAEGTPNYLYARCGGIFGVAGFVDRCMDAWMADPILNANDAVATWHQRAQRCGFKFLVTQLVCYLAGGPQRYTGRPMDACSGT